MRHLNIRIISWENLDSWFLLKQSAWMDLETVIQSQVSQKEKKKYCMLTHIYEI